MAIFTNEVLGPLTDTELRATAVPISAASLPLPSGAATLAAQTQPGVDIGDVTINNTSGAGAVNIQDGGNSITVDGPLTDTQLRASPVPITGSVTTSGSTTGTATVTRVAVNNTTAVTLSASNAAKTRVIIYNEGGTLYVKFGATASSTDYTYVMTVDSTLEITGYYGLLTARKASGSTNVQVTEVGI